MIFGRSIPHLAWKILFYGILGFVAIVVGSIVLSLASVLLVCAIAGFLLWMPFHTLFLRRRKKIRNLCADASASCRRVGSDICSGSVGVLRTLESAPEKIRETSQAVIPFLLEMVSGALIGCLLAWLSSPNEVNPLVIVIGAVVGLLLGGGVAAARRVRA